MNRTPVADWQQLSALYELADTLDPEPLEDWLAQMRQQAHPLLAQLEQMLAARQQIQGNGFLGALPHLPTRPEPRLIAWQAGSRIGPYRLSRKIGSGGMAEVWLAQRDDGAFQRQVAIKLLFRHKGSDQRDSFAQRFDRERDILASLDHPHIAALHDAGVTPNGQPWLALEYVEGQTLTTWCDARYLTIEARVRLFRQVLLAVQHAHANLVIHRDLKPGNILVTAQGEVRLLDFGIAKLMEPEGGTLLETELTRIAGRPMTPQYASPEQLMGHPLTTACDVYSLGVVLYELLCGERPYELKVESTAQLEQAILEAEPRAPSRRALAEPIATARGTTGSMLRKVLAVDLDAIVLRALAKQPAQRYGSVEALGADLDRWLGGEPVEARTPSTVYRVGKFVRRHTLSVSLGVGGVAALAGVAAVAVVMGLQAREDSARAVAARDFMLNIFQRADQEKSRGADITARDLLDLGRRNVAVQLSGQPRLQAELLRGIANVQSSMGEYASADSTLDELAHVASTLRRPAEEAMARADRAYNAVQMNNPDLAAVLLVQAKAVAGRPRSEPALNARLAEVDGWVAINRGELDRARDVLAAGHETATHSLGETHLRTFELGRALLRAERALRHVDAALQLQDELRRIAPRVVGLEAKEVAALDWERGDLLYSAGRYAEALRLLETAHPACIASNGQNDQSCRLLLIKKVQTQVRTGNLQRARDELPAVSELAREDAGARVAPFLRIEALLLQLRIEMLKAPQQPPPELVERVRAFGESGSEVAMRPVFKAYALLLLGEVNLASGNAAQASKWLDHALVLELKAGQPKVSNAVLAIGYALKGVAALQAGDGRSALAWSERSEAAFANATGPDHPSALIWGLNRALALHAVSRDAEALAVVSGAEPTLAVSLGEGSPQFQAIRNLRARLEEAKKMAGRTEPFAGPPYSDGIEVRPRIYFFS